MPSPTIATHLSLLRTRFSARARRIAFATALLLVTLLTLGGHPSQAQVTVAPTPTPSATALISPDLAAVQFDNRVLFSVYASGDLTARDRADLANLRLAQLLQSMRADGAPEKLPEVTVGVSDGSKILLLNGEELLTVTQTDVTTSGSTPDQLAQSWAARINKAIRQARVEYQPRYLRWAAIRSCIVLGLGIVVQMILWLLARRFSVRLGWPSAALLWLAVAIRIIDLFPQTRPIESVLMAGALRPVTLIAMVGLPTAVIVRFWRIVMRKLVPPLPERVYGHETADRAHIRRVTLARVVEVTVSGLVWTVAIFTALTLYGINLGSLLTSAGLISVAVGLVAQDALKDLVAGFNILSDDRFGVGDSIEVGAYSGTVEYFSLRATKIRDMSGRLITISNRSIVEVANLTAHWGQVDFKVGVSYYDDLKKAMEILLTTAETLAAEWPERLVGSPEILGVESFEETHVAVRLTLRTRPGVRDAVARELRARVKIAFDEAGIAMLNALHTPTVQMIEAKDADDDDPPEKDTKQSGERSEK